ncbi:MAG: LysR family transcriptional regulator [Gammaproteobacteria bacterium]|nr:LysR family transcriptional regulator [Gammaproteobacteria bacterium]
MDTMIGNLREIDIKRLRIFMTIVECGGFARAQNELNLSASTISVRMSELEFRLGLRLCHRGRSGFELTPEGDEVYRACQILLLAHENFISSVGVAKGIISGELRVGIIDNLIFDPNISFNKALSDFHEQTSGLEISLYTMTPNELERAVLEQKLHLAIGVFYDRTAGLQYYSLFHEKLVLYCGAGHPLFGVPENAVTVENLQQCEYIERTYGQTLSHLNKPLHLKACAFSSSLEATAILIQTGKYIGLLPQYYALQWSEQGLIKPLLAAEIFIESEVSAAIHKKPQNEAMTQGLLVKVLDSIA